MRHYLMLFITNWPCLGFAYSFWIWFMLHTRTESWSWRSTWLRLIMWCRLQLSLGLHGSDRTHLSRHVFISVSWKVCTLLRLFLYGFNLFSIIHILLFIIVASRHLTIYRSLLRFGYHHLSLSWIVIDPLRHLMMMRLVNNWIVMRMALSTRATTAAHGRLAHFIIHCLIDLKAHIFWTLHSRGVDYKSCIRCIIQRMVQKTVIVFLFYVFEARWGILAATMRHRLANDKGIVRWGNYCLILSIAG